MKKNFMLRGIFLLLVLPCMIVSAKENSSMETFITQMKESTPFVPVSNLWQPDNNFDTKALLENVEKAMPLSVDYSNVATFMKQKNTAITLAVPTAEGKTFTIELARYDFLTNDFEVHGKGADNKDTKLDYMPGLYYRGIVNGIPGSVAAFSFFNNEMYGIFSIPGVGNYVVAPNTMVGAEYDYNTHYVVYNDVDLKIKNNGPGCATDELAMNYKPANKTTTTLSNNIYNTCREVRCFEVCDFSMYTKKGGNVTNVTNYMTSLFNVKSTLYRNESILITLKYIQINTATDEYQSLANNSVFWLDKFGWVTQTTMHGCDVATLFATKYGSMGGVAWVQTLCSGYYASDSAGPYAFCNFNNNASTTVSAFPTYSWEVEVSTHEMGHVLGSPHTHRCCWNPPGTGTTVIDGCYTIEGTCMAPTPPHPVGGGTIMSYCHLTSVGINFSNGFGPQPGDTVRHFVSYMFAGGGCGSVYSPAKALQTASRSIAANRECIDPTGITYYWKDNNTADTTDDTLVLMINKGTSNIGDLNTAGFSVTANTVARYATGTGDTITFPAGTPGILAHSIGMRRYWSITGANAPTSAVEVIFPFMQADTADVNGSVPGNAMLTDYRIYNVASPVDPNPTAGFTGATAANFTMYTKGATASATNWALSTAGGVNYAHIMTTKVSGGGTGFYTYNTMAVSGVDEVNAATGVLVYPNPTHDQWSVSVAKNNNDIMTFQLYTTDGRAVKTQVLHNSAVNTVNAADLPDGIYFYRIVGGSNVYTGNLIKK